MMPFIKMPHLQTAAGLLLAVWLGSAPGPAAAQDSAPGDDHIVTVDGVARSFVVHMPTHLPNPAPVVLVFHGTGGRPQTIERKSGMDELADEHGFVAVYPAGTGRDSGRRGTWNIGGQDGGAASNIVAAVSSDDVAFVRAILRAVDSMAPIDHARIYATGVSIGGIFAYHLGCEMSDTLAAIAPVAATMVEPSCQPGRPVAVLHIQGADDDRIPLKGRRGVSRYWPAPQEGISTWSRLDNCAGDPTRSNDASVSCTTYNQCRATVEFCVVAGEGHGWPSGASARIWAFFAAHSKQAD